MTTVDRSNPFSSTVKECYRLNRKGSTKETWHFVLDIHASGIRYRSGDSIAIIPQNDPELVSDIIEALGYVQDERIVDPKTGTPFSIEEWLLKKCNIASFSHKLLQFLQEHTPNPELKRELQFFLTSDGHEACKQFILTHDVREVVIKCAPVGPSQAFIYSLQPLLPRFYSIAAAQLVVGDEIHLTVSRVRYEIEGKKRCGICSHFLCDLIQRKPQPVPMYMHPTKEFLMPDSHMTPMIMIGPGTGVAPYRAFMQEREQAQRRTDKNWLFFGERQRAFDFFYEEYWFSLLDKGLLKLDCAFSRDTPEKVYVQHKMWEKRDTFWQWLQDGAVVYVCGDATRMAKDVDHMLSQIVQDQGRMSPDEAKSYILELKRAKRYLRDVY